MGRKKQAKLQLDDYRFRSSQLHNLPLYFFFAACRVRDHLDRTSLPWEELPDPAIAGEFLRQHSYDPDLHVRSKRFP